MIAVYLVYGLAFFSLGLAVWLESRRASGLPLSRQLPWLAAFGIIHGLVEWLDMLLLLEPPEPHRQILLITRTILMPLSTLLLIRFGVGLIGESGPLPRWTWFAPVFLLIPAALLVGYALTSDGSDLYTAVDIWSRYLFYLSGSLLAGLGFIRQGQRLNRAGISGARNLMYGAGLVFLANALVAGLIVPAAPYGLAPWINYDLVIEVTGIPVQLWRMIAAVAATFFVIRALDVFEADRERQLQRLQAEREEALLTLQSSEKRFRTVFEMAPIGMDIVDGTGRPLQANYALQKMLGYSADELRSMVFTDYTHPDDVPLSQQLVAEVAAGTRDSFQVEKRYYSKNGRLVWAHVAVSGVRDADGKLLYFIAMVEDMTERKRIEETLRLERERAQELKLEAQTLARQAAEEWAGSLVDISRRITEMDDLDSVLSFITSQTRHLLKADGVCLGLMDEAGSNLELKFQAAADKVRLPDVPVVIENDLLLEILRSGRPRRLPAGVDRSNGIWPSSMPSLEITDAIVVPLHFDEHLVGGLWAGRTSDQPFLDSDLSGLESMADQSVIALQHALMAGRLQSLAVMEERSRIAREMHDGLAQVLGYLGLQVQTLEALTRQGDLQKILAELEQTRKNIKVAQADVRENILSLRTTLAGEAGVFSALQEFVTEFGLQSGTKAHLYNEAGAANLSPLAEVQLVRIIQETLANVRKHAQAEMVEVKLTAPDGRLRVTVTDDGIGFEPAGTRHQFGLQTMRERAESVGGGLTITSAPDAGTRVDLWLPVLPDAGADRKLPAGADRQPPAGADQVKRLHEEGEHA